MIVCMEWPKLKIINNLRPFFFKKKNVNSRLFFYLGHYFFFQLDPIILCLLRFRNNDVFWSTMLCWLRFKNDGLFRFIFDVVNLISKKNLVIVLVPNLTENNLILLFAYNWKWEEWNCLIEQIFRKTIFVSLPFPQIHSLGFDKKIFFGPLSLEIDWQSTTLFFLHYSPCERRERVVRLWYEKVDKHPLFSYKTCYSWCQRFYSMKIVLFRLFFFSFLLPKK